MKKFTVLSIAALVLLWVTTTPVAAQDAPKQGMTISPPTFELSANPGDTIKNSVRVDNLTPESLTVFVDKKNFTALGEEGQVELTEDNSTFSLASWITVSASSANIPAKGSHTFDFTIAVPANAEPGGKFGSIVFRTNPKPVNETGLAIGQEVGALVLLKIAGDLKDEATIEAFKAAKSFMEYGPVAFETRVKNSGNVHVKPTGSVTITDIFGNKVATVPIESRNILPGATRKINTEWSEKSLFGKYTATLSLQYGSKVITASSSFTVIPYKVVLIWLGVIIALGVGIFFWRDRIIRSVRILLGKE